MKNVHERTLDSFGREWSRFTQLDSDFTDIDRQSVFDSYFRTFPWDELPANAFGVDIGCGSGRWAVLVAPRVGRLLAIDPSSAALQTAKKNLNSFPNVTVLPGEADDIPADNASLDFAYCLGVLHHVPDTAKAIASTAKKMKPGAPLLLYVYYNLDNRPAWYRWIWIASNAGRISISAMPKFLQAMLTWLIAALIYWPIARTALMLDKVNALPANWPLSFYRAKAFYVMHTDAYDRFCTPLEKRFSKQEIETILLANGFCDIRFSDSEPYWACIAYRNSRGHQNRAIR